MEAIHRLLSVPRGLRDDRWLFESLQEAVEIEFSTIPLYLYAMWSLDDASVASAPGDTVRAVVKQEMLHMGIVANILAGLGGRPLFVNTPMRRDVVPTFPGMLKAGVHAGLVSHLKPLSKTILLDVFMVIEEPDQIPTGGGGPDFKPSGEKTIGKFYREISFQLDSLGGSRALDVNRQIDISNYFSAPPPFPTVAEAKKGIEIIVSQGEGAGGTPFGPDGRPAHFYQFASLRYTGQLTGTGSGPFSYVYNKSLEFNVRKNAPTDPPPTPDSKGFDDMYSRMLDGLQVGWDTGGKGDLDDPIFNYMDKMRDVAVGLMNKEEGPGFVYSPAAPPTAPPGAFALTSGAPVPTYSQVQQALDRAINDVANIGAHGAFWRTLTRDEFVVKKVFGKQLVVGGDPANSNILKALRGETPFGSDTGTSGAALRRMPAGLPPMREEDIALIETWIRNGCSPDPPALRAPMALSFTTGAHFTSEQHNDYWRDFDNWALFNATPEIQDAVGIVFDLFSSWAGFAKDSTKESAFSAAIRAPYILAALQLLSDKQKATVEQHYGTPAPLLGLLDSYQRFGAGTLPDDAKRPVDPHHRMNGATMWFVWAAFVEAAVRSNLDADFWHFMLRAILCGTLSDGLERGRFHVVGFTKGNAEEVFASVQRIANADLLPEMRRRYGQSGL